jgi:carboxypeptidase D
LTFPPPPEAFPLALPGNMSSRECNVKHLVQERVRHRFGENNDTVTCFSEYNVAEQSVTTNWTTCEQEHMYDTTNHPFTSTVLQKVIHAPEIGKGFQLLRPDGGFLGYDAAEPALRSHGLRGDQSVGPAQNGVLQRVIEYTNNTIISTGELDMVIIPNGTLLALQNMTWNGQKGFQKYPNQEYHLPNEGDSHKFHVAGTFSTERGLTFLTARQNGHSTDKPNMARILEILLGIRSGLGPVVPYTFDVRKKWKKWVAVDARDTYKFAIIDMRTD